MGTYLDKPITEKDSSDDVSASFAFGSSGMQGWRSNMEDSHINILSYDGDENAALFAVFDGHGGSEVAKFCKEKLPVELLKLPEYKEKLYKEALKSGFLKMDEIILSEWPKSLISYAPQGRPCFSDEGAYQEGAPGCTAVACLIKGGQYHIANAGDSRIVLCRSAKAIELSTDHKPELDGERERIESAGGYVSDGRVNGNLNLTRAIGDFAYKKDSSIGLDKQIITACPDISSVDMLPEDDFLILACDGVWDRKTSQEVVDFVRLRLDGRRKTSTVVEELLDELISPDVTQTDGLGCDNMTCVLVDLNPEKRKSATKADSSSIKVQAEASS